LIDELLNLLIGVDYTLFFRKLSGIKLNQQPNNAPVQQDAQTQELLQLFSEQKEKSPPFSKWLNKYKLRLLSEIHAKNDTWRENHMNSINPKYILRNYIAKMAIDGANSGDYSIFNNVVEALEDPFDSKHNPALEKFAAKPPSWAKDILISSKKEALVFLLEIAFSP